MPIIAMRSRRTYLTDEQRQELRECARRLHAVGFRKEELRIYVPETFDDQRAARDERIARALASGLEPRQISRTEDVSLRLIRQVQQRVRGKVPP